MKGNYDYARDGFPIITTLCWDCKNVYGDCEWSKSFKPVPGWVVRKTRHDKKYGDLAFDSFKVYDCPKFVRDSYLIPPCESKRVKEAEQNGE